MLDLAITGGTVIDGTGAPRRRADVGVRDGRIVALGPLDEAAHRTVDAEGQVVSPGFIDIHTHYDAQLWWDPSMTPSSLHGVTTVIAGNCGFTLAPMAPEHTDYITRMLALVEGMPLETLTATVPYDWRTFGDFLDKVQERRTAVNMGFMVGHSTLRRYVMGPDAVGHAASPEQLSAMCQLLAESIEAGGLGFSSSAGENHLDGDGNPVPSRSASIEELVQLAGVAGRSEGTSLEMIPTKVPGSLELVPGQFELLTSMSAQANRAINWNVLQAHAHHADTAWRMIDNSAAASASGGRIVPLTACDVLRAYLTFQSGFLLGQIPGWNETMKLSAPEKLAAFADPRTRARLTETADQFRWSWADMTVVRTTAPEHAGYEGRLVGDIAAETGRRPIDVVLDMVVKDRLETVLLIGQSPGSGDEAEAWKLRGEVWADPRVLVGASDAGAHLDLLTTFTFGTSVLSACREHGLMGLEQAVQLVTDRPARLYGLRGRGRIEEGAAADLVVFEPTTIARGPIYWRDDVPAGAGRLFSDAMGIHHVVVAGQEIVEDNRPVGNTPGIVLRSGRDTSTVTAR